jgi:hypothetical protein
MTPKEKAEELVDNFIDKMFHLRDGYNASEVFDAAKQCALIAVNLLMEEAYRQHDYEGFISYWKEVKQEIENYG